MLLKLFRFPDANVEGGGSSAPPDANSGETSSVSLSATSEPTEPGSLAEVLEKAKTEAVAKAEANKPAAETPLEGNEVPSDEVPEGEKPKPVTAEEAVEPTEPEQKDTFQDHPRFKELLAERDTARAEAAENKQYAERARQLDAFCQQHNLVKEDLYVAYELAALSKSNPALAAQRLMQLAENIQVQQGQLLPADLRKKVEEGVIDEGTAKELAQLRLQKQGLENNSKVAQMEAAQRATLEMTTAISSWETTKAKSDTSWPKLQDFVYDRFSQLVAANPPRSSAEAITLAEQAYTEVKKRLTGLNGRLPERKVLPTSKSTSTNTKPDLAINEMSDVGKLVRHVAAGHR